MAPRFHRYFLAAFEALSEHAELVHKPRPPVYGRSQSFNRHERRDVRGNARGKPEHGGFNEAMLQKEKPHVYMERRRRAIHPFDRIAPALSQNGFHIEPLHHRELHHSLISLPSTENSLHHCSSCHMHPMYSSAPPPQGIHVQMLGHSSATGRNCIHMRPVSSIMQHDPVQVSTNHEKEKVSKKKPVVVVVLLGWLGAKHRHLKKYADWYTSQGMHAITFTIPMKDVLTLKAQKHVEILCQKLLEWLREDATSQGQEKLVILHTFSNTGWMTYGALLERLLQSNDGVALVKKIKGCVVDSAPAPKNDPRVWAAGLCAALLKKSSIATQMHLEHVHTMPSMKETVLIALFEKLLAGFLCLPYVKRRIDGVVLVLSRKQPSCPQLYLYSNADTVVPAVSVESFVAEQQKAGYVVQACNFDTSPHVDHFRSFPLKYMEQLAKFIESCLPQNGKDSRKMSKMLNQEAS